MGCRGPSEMSGATASRTSARGTGRVWMAVQVRLRWRGHAAGRRRDRFLGESAGTSSGRTPGRHTYHGRRTVSRSSARVTSCGAAGGRSAQVLRPLRAISRRSARTALLVAGPPAPGPSIETRPTGSAIDFKAIQDAVRSTSGAPDGHGRGHERAGQTDPVGRVSMEGPGAGGPATSSAVLADLLEIARSGP